jgi:glycerophosphocholine phosphodiesterase GPCPD1
VKWAQKLENGLLEENLDKNLDKNLYIDRILDIVLEYAGKRRIVFSCFDAECCVMLRNKQNIFPVMFLTIGKTQRYPKYSNPCCNSMDNAVKFASANEVCKINTKSCSLNLITYFWCVILQLLGVVAHTEDLLQDISQIDLAKELGLVCN